MRRGIRHRPTQRHLGPYRETAGFGASLEFPLNAGPICLKPPLEDDPDVAKLPHPNPLTAPRMRDRLDALRAFRARAGDHDSIMGWVEGPAAEAADLRGLSNFFSISSMTNPPRGP